MANEASFSKLINAMALEDAVSFLGRVVKDYDQQDPNVLAEVVAGAIAFGAYTAAALHEASIAHGVEYRVSAPDEELEDFARQHPLIVRRAAEVAQQGVSLAVSEGVDLLLPGDNKDDDKDKDN